MFVRKFAIVVPILVSLAACNPFAGAYTYRYRVTVEVETPQGLRSGSSVWETSAWEGSGIPDRSIRSRERGEAVAVDLPGGTLFALLRGQDMDYDYPTGIVEGHLVAHPEPGVPMDRRTWRENRKAIAKARPAFELYPDEYPLLARFRDNTKPETVEKVDQRDLAATFGPGVRLRSIVIRVTDDSVTTGIEDRLKWLPEQKGSLLKMPRRTPMRDRPFAGLITDGDFWRGTH